MIDAGLVQAVRAHGGVLGEWLGVELPIRFAGTESEWKAAREGGAVFVAGYRALIAATGADRAQFLQGMLSNDVKRLAPGDGICAALLTQQAKIVADLRVYADTDRLLLDLLATRVEPVLEALNRFLVADDVELELAAEQPLVGVCGPASPGILQSALGTDVSDVGELMNVKIPFRGGLLRVVAVPETGVAGFLVCGAGDVGGPLFEALCAAGAVPLGGQAHNILRIEAGLPWYGIDMDEDVLLMEVGLEQAVSYTKGCYLGQEVVERVTARGHVNRKLTGLLIDGAGVPAGGADVVADGRSVGHITSAVRSLALDRVVALGYVHRNHLQQGSPVAVQVGEGMAQATVTALPLVATRAAMRK